MNPFCPSSGAFLRGTLAFSHARTSSRKVFSDSLRSKSMRLILTCRVCWRLGRKAVDGSSAPMRPISGVSPCPARLRMPDALAAPPVPSPGSGPPGSPNLSPKVFGRASSDRRQHLRGQQLQRIRVVEEEVLEHEEVDAQRPDAKNLLGDLLRGADEPRVFPILDHLGRCHVAHRLDYLRDLRGAFTKI